MYLYIVVSFTNSLAFAFNFTIHPLILMEPKQFCNLSSHTQTICSKHIAHVIITSLSRICSSWCWRSIATLPSPSQSFVSISFNLKMFKSFWAYSICTVFHVHPPFLYFCCTHIWVNYVGAKGRGHPWHLWDHRFMGNGKEVFDVGMPWHSSVTPLFA
jgi:hypothetical protein